MAVAVALLTVPAAAQSTDAHGGGILLPAKLDAEGASQMLIPIRVQGHTFWCNADSGGSRVLSLDLTKALDAGLRPNATGTNAGVGPRLRLDNGEAIEATLATPLCLSSGTVLTRWAAPTTSTPSSASTSPPARSSGSTHTPATRRSASRTTTGALTIVDAADGKQIWTTARLQPIGVNAPDPVIDGTKVFVTAGRAFGGALFDVTGDTKPLWEQEGLSSHWHTSVCS